MRMQRATGVIFVALSLLGLTSYVRGALHVVALGDALTAGIYVHEEAELRFHPYADTLKKLLRDEVDEDAEVMVQTSEHVLSAEIREASAPDTSSTLRTLMPGVLRRAAQAHRNVDWVLIMGGYTDLALGKDARQIFIGLREVYELCTTQGAKVVAMTVMESSDFLEQGILSYDRERLTLNDYIREFVHRVESRGQIVLLDTAKEFSWSGLDKESQKKIWSDGRHLTPEGYDRLAKQLLEVLKKQITGNKV